MVKLPEDYAYFRRWCTHCGQERLCFPLPSPWKGHFLLTVFTLGVWLPAAIIMLICHRSRPYRCMSCSRRTSGADPAGEPIIKFRRLDSEDGQG